MRVLRGRADDPETDRERTADLLDWVREAGEPAVRVWIPHRQVAFGRREARAEGYQRARAAATARGYRPLERGVGGRAVAYTGHSTLAFARIEPVEDMRRGMDDRYERLTDDVAGALADLGVAVERGEPSDAFCPGDHSLRRPDGGKVAGIAQRITRGAALTSGVLLGGESEELREVLGAVYGALDQPFDTDSVGSVAAGGDPTTLRDAVERALVGDADPAVRTVDGQGSSR